ncbi:MAG: hypothetical protein A2682_00270 [Candidatus Terrybacteria bacterium RIFCSPHIGHO2_01_FULL_58_15]|uniref:Response regulatory domain-containing protein n=1 Tax=Terrybacteria sp. (strain RIFCSPHIGHO2_01_FULL_58_15) TaxID=1802363 RepID=A0A1G2PM97_TERXR|nr:MAG: hypothetical protein A2682_00270 [Candidatus Terrybacteria bacterium RIFCSPHIGHO2_01_FULL_58_15]
MRHRSSKNREKILIIEDDPSLQAALVEALSASGFLTHKASDGPEGIEVARKEGPALILLDLLLPGQSGFEVLRLLKRDEQLKRIPVIVLTNLGSPEDVDRALALGATTFLVKANYEIQDVIEKIRRVLADPTPRVA